MEASQPGGQGQHAPRRKGWELRKAARMMPHTLLELCGKKALLLGGKRERTGQKCKSSALMPWAWAVRPIIARLFQILQLAGERLLSPDQHSMRLNNEPLQA